MTTFCSRWGKLGPQRQLALPAIGPPEPLASARPIGSSAHWNQPAEQSTGARARQAGPLAGARKAVWLAGVTSAGRCPGPLLGLLHPARPVGSKPRTRRPAG